MLRGATYRDHHHHTDFRQEIVKPIDLAFGLARYVVMEKRTGWGAECPPEKRNGEWQFQAFNADKSVNPSEKLDRCFACHKGQKSQDFVFTLDRMQSAK